MQQRRLRIIMDENHEIDADGETNWVDTPFDIEWSVSAAIAAHRDTLVLQPDTQTWSE